VHFTVTPGYFALMEIPILAGRALAERDDAAAPPVAVVSEGLARALWPDEDPLGRRLRIGEGDWRTVVGVARDTRKAVSAERLPDVYVPYAQSPRAFVSVVARTDGDPGALAPTLRRAVARVDDALALADVEPMADVVARDGSRHRALAALLAVFALFALGLAVLGLYSSLSYVVAQRARELAIRVALGADTGAIARLVLGEGAATVAAGLAAGTALSLALTRALSAQLYGVTATDPATFVGVAAVLGAVALAAVAAPARRAARVDPAAALRGG
jgi:putative ABC transport system permease protein